MLYKVLGFYCVFYLQECSRNFNGQLLQVWYDICNSYKTWRQFYMWWQNWLKKTVYVGNDSWCKCIHYIFYDFLILQI